MADIIEGTLHDWRELMLRLQTLTRNDQGASVIRVQILCIRGKPAYWFEPEKKAVEPAIGAQAFCNMFDGAGTA